MTFGILDFGDIETGSNGIEAIHNTIEFAQLAEKHGFDRYWLTEHYEEGLAWRNPELIINLIAGYTENINVGASGVLVYMNNPFRIAQDYRLLANLYPNRIDLGFARGTTDENKFKIITNNNNDLSTYYNRITKIKGFFDNENEYIKLTPKSGFNPNLWMLGTSNNSIEYAVMNKMNFSLSLFHTIDGDLPSPVILSDFRKKFLLEHGFEPSINIAISILCHNDIERIEEEKRVRKNVRINIASQPDKLLSAIKRLRSEYEVNEIIILNLGKNKEEKEFLIKQFDKHTTDREF